MPIAISDEELVMAAVPAGTKELAQHLVGLYDDNAKFRVDDYHLGMAASILLNPQAHLDALTQVGILRSNEDSENRYIQPMDDIFEIASSDRGKRWECRKCDARGIWSLMSDHEGNARIHVRKHHSIRSES